MQVSFSYSITHCLDMPFRFYAIHLSNALEALNSSANFVLYIIFYPRFREILCATFRRPARRPDALLVQLKRGTSASARASLRAEGETRGNSCLTSTCNLTGGSSCLTSTNNLAAGLGCELVSVPMTLYPRPESRDGVDDVTQVSNVNGNDSSD